MRLKNDRRNESVRYYIRHVLLENQSYICFRCGKISPSLDIHHISYPAKTSSDLVLLCRRCHKKVHQGAPLYPLNRFAQRDHFENETYEAD
jgi:5-methylcytosine-specific restriction endonuclease McrA